MAEAAAAGTVLGAAGGVVGAFGARREGRDREAALRFQQGIVETETINDLEDLERDRVAILGSQRASFAARGVKVNVGSPMSLEAETDRRAGIQKARIQKAGGQRAQLFKMEADMTRRATNAKFIGDLLSTAGGAAKSAADVSTMDK